MSQLDVALTGVPLTLTFDFDIWPWILKVKLYLGNGRPDCHRTKGTGVDRMPWCEAQPLGDPRQRILLWTGWLKVSAFPSTCLVDDIFVKYISATMWERYYFLNDNENNKGKNMTKCFLLARGVILCMRPANEKPRYSVTPTRFGWAHTQNDPWAIVDHCIRPTYFAEVSTLHYTQILIFSLELNLY